MAQKGLGNVTWWGLSPTFDIRPAIPSDATGDGPANALLVGAGDARHILTTMARGHRHPKRPIHFYVVEGCLESVARQMLFLHVALESPASIGLGEKTDTFLELYGNSMVRPQTRDYLTRFANLAIRLVTDADFAARTMPVVDLTPLKFKERDFLEAILKFWREEDVAKFPMNELWDGRNRQYLETRYDYRRNVFDWDYNMKLKEKDARVINGKQYAHWREKGVAFESRDGCFEFPNRSLASGVLLRVKGEKVARRGYFGDIVTSPYVAFGIETEDKELLKTQNGEHVNTAVDISSTNATAMFHEMAFGTRYVGGRGRGGGDASTVGGGEEDTGPKITEIIEEEEEKEEEKKKKEKEEEEDTPTLEEILEKNLKTSDESEKGSSESAPDSHPPIAVDDVKVIFLPLACVKDLTKKQKFRQFFHFAFFSNSLVHLLEPETKCLFAEGAELAVESTKFILDLNIEHHEQYAGKIIGMAEKAGFKRKTTFDVEKDAVARFQFVMEE